MSIDREHPSIRDIASPLEPRSDEISEATMARARRIFGKDVKKVNAKLAATIADAAPDGKALSKSAKKTVIKAQRNLPQNDVARYVIEAFAYAGMDNEANVGFNGKAAEPLRRLEERVASTLQRNQRKNSSPQNAQVFPQPEPIELGLLSQWQIARGAMDPNFPVEKFSGRLPIPAATPLQDLQPGVFMTIESPPNPDIL
jgi:hypothetical protein